MNNDLMGNLVLNVLKEGVLSVLKEGEVNPASDATYKGWNIAILDRGWVVVGEVTKEGRIVTITDAHHIRRWGTTKGLGELIEGPTHETILDYCGDVETHELCVNHFIKVDDRAWAKHKKS